MTDCTAKIRAKGLDSTGVTEEIASTLYAAKGKHMMAIVEVRAVERHEKADGTRRVDLVIEQVEPAVDAQLAEHLRELTRTLYANRQEANGQAAIDDTLTPNLKDAIAAGTQHEPHPFLPTDAAAANPTCEVCGLAENAAVHQVDTDRTTLVDPFETATEEAEPVPG